MKQNIYKLLFSTHFVIWAFMFFLPHSYLYREQNKDTYIYMYKLVIKRGTPLVML